MHLLPFLRRLPSRHPLQLAFKYTSPLQQRNAFMTNIKRVEQTPSVQEWVAALARSTASPQEDAEQPVFFFDCDNTLYHPSANIHKMMEEKILDYFKKLGIPDGEAAVLMERYYIQHGLAIKGLIKNHKIDPLDYDRHVDGSLPLQEVLKPDPALRLMLQRLHMKKWIFTNAGLAHAQRVLRLLNIDDLFDGITYCDYTRPGIPCKPETRFYLEAMQEAGVTDPKKCIFVDDSRVNIEAAMRLGWLTVHVLPGATLGRGGGPVGHFQIEDIKDLEDVLPELWAGATMQQKR
ncbi:uncharacterized protein VTP21DRAFT_308 [Calcarisporiella thermophila]|uniref:uncharacterized protein n=1 Tax=Calcarisporiella thermophila TaxID=911321 RepID=UPI003743AC79